MPFMPAGGGFMPPNFGGYAPAPTAPRLGTTRAGGGGGSLPGLLLPRQPLTEDQARQQIANLSPNAGRRPSRGAAPIAPPQIPMPPVAPPAGGGGGVPIETPEVSLPEVPAGLGMAAAERGGPGFVEKMAPGLMMALGQRIPPRFTPALSLQRKVY